MNNAETQLQTSTPKQQKKCIIPIHAGQINAVTISPKGPLLRTLSHMVMVLYHSKIRLEISGTYSLISIFLIIQNASQIPHIKLWQRKMVYMMMKQLMLVRYKQLFIHLMSIMYFPSLTYQPGKKFVIHLAQATGILLQIILLELRLTENQMMMILLGTPSLMICSLLKCSSRLETNQLG